MKQFRNAKKKDKQIRAYASKAMSVIRPLCRFFESHAVRSQLPDEVESLLKLGIWVQTLGRAKLGHGCHEDVATTLKTHGDAFVKAYGEYIVTAKFHWARHIPRRMIRDGFLVDTFAAERNTQ